MSNSKDNINTPPYTLFSKDMVIEEVNDIAATKQVLLRIQNACSLMEKEPIKCKDNLSDLKKLAERLERRACLNLVLIDTLQTDLNHRPNAVISKDDFPAKINSIPEDDTIIYLENAEMYKTYNSSDLGEFENNFYCQFKNKGPIFEVIRDHYPQKFLISVDGDVKDVATVSNYIISFLSQHSIPLKESDIIIYRDQKNETTGFLADTLVKDITEKQTFTEQLVKYMRKNGETDISNKIRRYTPLCDVDDVKFYSIPSEQDIIPFGNEKKKITIIDHLMSKTSHLSNATSNPAIIVNYTVNNNINNINSNNTNSVIKTAIKKPPKKTLETFYKHIYDTKPKWYKENGIVEIGVIEKAYRSYFNDESTDLTIISRKLNGSLFTKASRKNSIVRKQLVSYETLKTAFE